MAIVSVAGLLHPTLIYPTDELVRTFVANDVVDLLVGLPILLGSMWLASRGKWIGLLCWPGALFFVFYTYTVYILAVPLSWIFLLYLALVMSSALTLIRLLANVNGQVLQQSLQGAVFEKLTGAVLTGLGILFLLRALGVLVSALVSGVGPSRTELAISIADFLITPAWVIGGILLLRHKKFGSVIGLGLPFQGSMLFVGLIAFLLLQSLVTAAPFAAADLVVISVMGLICFIPFALFARGVISKREMRRFT